MVYSFVKKVGFIVKEKFVYSQFSLSQILKGLVQ